MRHYKVLQQGLTSLVLASLLAAFTVGPTFAYTNPTDTPIAIRLPSTIRLENVSDSGHSIADRMVGELQCTNEQSTFNASPLPPSFLKNPLDLSFRYRQDNRLVFSGRFFETKADGSIQPTKEVLQLATISAPSDNSNSEIIIEMQDRDSGLTRTESLDVSKGSRIWTGFSGEFATMYGEHALATLFEGLGYAAVGGAMTMAYLALQGTPIGWVLNVVVVGLFLWWAIDNGWSFFKMTLADDYEGIGQKLAIEVNHLVFAMVGSGCVAAAIGKIPGLGKFMQALRALVISGTEGFPNPGPAVTALLGKIGFGKANNDPDASSSGFTYEQLEAIFRRSPSQPSGMGGGGSYYSGYNGSGGGSSPVAVLTRPRTTTLPILRPNLSLAASPVQPTLALRPSLVIAPTALTNMITNKENLPTAQFTTNLLVEWLAYQNYLATQPAAALPLEFQTWRQQQQSFSSAVPLATSRLTTRSTMLIGFASPTTLPTTIDQISTVLRSSGWWPLDELDLDVEQLQNQRVSFIELIENQSATALTIGLNMNVASTLLTPHLQLVEDEDASVQSTVFVAPFTIFAAESTPPSPGAALPFGAGLDDPPVAKNAGSGSSDVVVGGSGDGGQLPPDAPPHTPDGPGDNAPRPAVSFQPSDYPVTGDRIPYPLQICAYGGGAAIVIYLIAKYAF